MFCRYHGHTQTKGFSFIEMVMLLASLDHTIKGLLVGQLIESWNVDVYFHPNRSPPITSHLTLNQNLITINQSVKVSHGG